MRMVRASAHKQDGYQYEIAEMIAKGWSVFHAKAQLRRTKETEPLDRATRCILVRKRAKAVRAGKSGTAGHAPLASAELSLAMPALAWVHPAEPQKGPCRQVLAERQAQRWISKVLGGCETCIWLCHTLRYVNAGASGTANRLGRFTASSANAIGTMQHRATVAAKYEALVTSGRTGPRYMWRNVNLNLLLEPRVSQHRKWAQCQPSDT